MKNLHLISTSRADFSLWRPIFDALSAADDFIPRFIVSGTHFVSSLGNTVQELRSVIPAASRYELIVPDSEDPGEIVPVMFEDYFRMLEYSAPDMILFLGDRFELLPLLTAALIRKIPIGHLYGGEMDVSSVVDTQVRNALTTVSQLHFVSHEDYKNRLLAMGEEEWRISVCGNRVPVVSGAVNSTAIFSYFEDLGMSVKDKKLVHCCYHPVTLFPGIWEEELEAIFLALDEFDHYLYIWTGTNIDTESSAIRKYIVEELEKRNNHAYVPHLGGKVYESLLSNAEFMIGNSSSGLLEAPSFRLPVVNVGKRQAGRLHGEGVFDSIGKKSSVVSAIKEALAFNKNHISNPFESSDFPFAILTHLREQLDNPALLFKQLTSAKGSILHKSPLYSR